MPSFVYQGRKTNEIAFPLGGIGTGCISVAGNGRLIDWEIFNRPNKGSFNGFSHFAIKAEQDGKTLDARVLNGDLHPPFTGQLNRPQYEAFGFGPPRPSLTGLPHFRDVKFVGPYPIANLWFTDPTFPGRVLLTAFNPFIPLNDKDSGIPAAFFEIEITNPTYDPITYTVAGTLANPLPAANRHRIVQEGGNTFLHLTSEGVASTDTAYGDLTLATDAREVNGQTFWYRGSWNDNLEVFWRDFIAPGPFRDRTYEEDKAGKDNHGTLAARITLRPGASKRIRFVIAWNFPNCANTWNTGSAERAAALGIPNTWQNYYATQWEDSRASASYSLEHWSRLFSDTHKFQTTLEASSLPPAVLDAVTANLSILKSPTVLRLGDGTVYGWEGCHPSAGCCEGSCTHVWNYAQSLPFLFPALERTMREADYRYNLMPDGGMPFRMQIPLGVPHQPENAHRPCADGQFGGVLKTYRDWKISGDTEWLRTLWPGVKASIEFAWSPNNKDQWDPEKTGVLWGRQHHTLDMELFGPSSWLTGFYLAALKAGAEIAEALGEPDTAEEYRALFSRGKEWVDQNLFDGEYYGQRIDLGDRALVEKFDALNYWSEEHAEIKYQIGDGCAIDQVLAQWHADLYGLEEIFDPEQNKKALAALFQHNFKKPMRDFYNPWRVFCLNDEAGIIMADWPEGRRKPAIPLTYAQETMNGFEYAAAIQMIQHGLVQEGTTLVEAIRQRYDGEKRNPWNEFECGSNYARSMASYALLNAFSGFTFDGVTHSIGFHPIHVQAGAFRCFWSIEGAWGEFLLKPGRAEIRVLYGELSLRRLSLPIQAIDVTMNRRVVEFDVDDGTVLLKPGLRIRKGQSLSAIGGARLGRDSVQE